MSALSQLHPHQQTLLVAAPKSAWCHKRSFPQARFLIGSIATAGSECVHAYAWEPR
jgi:hypothetical protein